MLSSKLMYCVSYRQCNSNLLHKNFYKLCEYKYSLTNYFMKQQLYEFSTNEAPKKIENDLNEASKLYNVVENPMNPHITRMFTSAKCRSTRYKKGLIMLEGKRLISDALQAGVVPKMILFNSKKLIEGLPLKDEYIQPNKTVLYKIPYRSVQLWSNLTTSPGIIGVFQMPNLENYKSPIPTYPITFVCDNIREPGNLGSVLRIAAAIPVEKVIILSGCVDIWDTKISRSSCGAIFNLKIINNISWEEADDLCTGNVVMADHLFTESDDVDPKVVTVEDLNFDDIDKLEEERTENLDNKFENDLRKIYNMPAISYHDIDYQSHGPIVLVIGGETEGLSEEAFQFSQSRKGIRVNIPMASSINSLNVATAVGIVTFEIKRQLSMNQNN